jgi:hypothetical protein
VGFSLIGPIQARAQEEPKWSLNVGGGFGNPVARASSFVDVGGNFTAGGGVKLNDVIGVNGEFMWQGLLRSSLREAMMYLEATSAMVLPTG